MVLKQTWNSLSTKFRPQWKDRKSSYQVKQILKRFCNLFAQFSGQSIFRLCSKVLLVCIGKPHMILQSSDSKAFFGLCMCHFSALLNPIFYITPNVSYRKLCHVSLLCTFPTLVLSIPTQYVQLFHQQHHILDGLNLSSLDHFSYFLFRGPGFVLLQ